MLYSYTETPSIKETYGRTNAETRKTNKFQIAQISQQHSLPDWNPFTACLSEGLMCFVLFPSNQTLTFRTSHRRPSPLLLLFTET